MRHINTKFINDLTCGELAYFLEKVKSNRSSLSLEVRNGYINIYYKGGNLLKITQKSKGYSFHFDAKYCNNKGNDQNFKLLNNLRSNDTESYIKHFDLIMREMDSWFAEHPKEERDYQHRLLVNNPEIIDIEYQIGHSMRLDMLMFKDGDLFIVENKFGTGAIGGTAGLSKHYSDICKILGDSNIREEIIDSICHISEAKQALGLNKSTIEKSNITRMQILFLLANYNSNSQTLNNELKKMNGSVPAQILMTTSDQIKIDLSLGKDVFLLEE